MPRRAELLALKSLHAQLADALARRDWEAFAPIDAAIRQTLERQAALAADPALQPARQALKRLHGEARQACAAECERLRRLLQSHLEYAEGGLAYRQINSLQGDA